MIIKEIISKLLLKVLKIQLKLIVLKQFNFYQNK